MIDKFLEISLLYDFYGQLLTEKQKTVIEYYYNDNFSLGEISETMDISRQGVYDILKRSEKLLYKYEERLMLVNRFLNQKDRIKEAYSLLDSMGHDEKIERIKSILGELIFNA